MITNNNVRSIHSGMLGFEKQAHRATDKVIPFVADAVSQANEKSLEAEVKLHADNKGLVETLNVLNDSCISLQAEAKSHENEWSKYNYVKPNTFVNKIIFLVISIGIFIGEWLMGALNLRGLNLEDSETYIASFAVCGAGFLAAKAIASTLRELPYKENDSDKKMAWWMIGLNVFFLVLMLVGMSFARTAAAVSSAQTGETTALSNFALFGLGLLQFALYAMQAATFWVWLPSEPLAERARLAFLKSKKRLQVALIKRSKVAAELDKNVNAFFAQFEAEKENSKRLIARYIGAIHAKGKSNLLGDMDTSVKDEWFLRPSPRVSTAVDFNARQFHEVVKENKDLSIAPPEESPPKQGTNPYKPESTGESK